MNAFFTHVKGEAIQKNDTGKQRKQAKKKKKAIRRVRVCQHRPVWAGQVEARFLESINVCVNRVKIGEFAHDTCGHPKTDLFENVYVRVHKA